MRLQVHLQTQVNIRSPTSYVGPEVNGPQGCVSSAVEEELLHSPYTIADPAYARKPTAAELQKGIHNLAQVLSIVKMYFPLFGLSGRVCCWQTLSSIYYLGQKVL